MLLCHRMLLYQCYIVINVSLLMLHAKELYVDQLLSNDLEIGNYA
jgi:hypothetical protein